MIAFRLRHPGFMRPEFYSGRDGSYNAIPDIVWFDEKGEAIDWDEAGPCLSLRMDGSRADILADKDDNDFFIMFNGSFETMRFKIADPLDSKKWVRTIDTSLASPQDILLPGEEALLIDVDHYTLPGRSMAVLISRLLY